VSDRLSDRFYESGAATSWFGHWALSELERDVRRFEDRIDELLDRYPDFDHHDDKLPERREIERDYLLRCQGRLSMIESALNEMSDSWVEHWPT
jgi:hypothetical protein